MSRKPPSRPGGAPPPDLGALSQKKPKGSSGGLAGGGKRPPGPPPGLPPSKREAGATEAKSLTTNKKPPPSGEVPQDLRERGSRTVQPRPPPKGKPPPPGAPTGAEAKAPPRGKAPPAAKPGGRAPPRGPPPGAPPSDGGFKPQLTAPQAPPRARTGPGGEPDDPFGHHAGASAIAQPKGRGAPPAHGHSRAPPPHRHPDGAPDGKAPPMGAPPDDFGDESSPGKRKGPGYGGGGAGAARRPPPGAPPGRAPPPGLPPGQRPPPPSGLPPGVAEARAAEAESARLAELRAAGDASAGVAAPEVPAPPDEAPPEEEDQGANGPPPGAPPPPLGPPPKLRGPDAPGEDAHGDLSKEMLAELPAGRLRIQCIMGHNVRKKGQAAGRTKVDAFLNMRLGQHKKAPVKRTATRKKSNEQPNFQEEVVQFDVVNVMEYVTKGDISCKIELLDENTFGSTCLGEMELSVLQFMRQPNKPVRDKFPIKPPEGKEDTFKSSLELEIKYEEAKVGMLALTLYEGRNLKNQDLMGKQDPYLTFNIGDKYQKKSEVAVDGGTNPYFKEEEILMWVDRRNWVHDLLVQALDQDEGTDDLIGQATVSLLELMEQENPDLVKEQLVEVFDKDNTRGHGHLLLRPQFLPAGDLKIHCIEGKGLRAMDTAGRQDPYVVFKVDGQAVTIVKKTKVDTDGGTDPNWDEVLHLDIVDHYELEIECYDHDLLAEDDLIGKTTVSLLPVFKKGAIDTWVTIQSVNEYGQAGPAGDIHIVMEFFGPHGIFYPQHQPGVDSFDDSMRIQVLKKEGGEISGEHEKKEQQELAMDVMDTLDKPKIQRDTTFSDAEIEAAFRFIDLDKNGYIGAAEIRHILICMGEMITDEEVDMMINMVDSDGDGQVSYTEFYDLVTDPDPGRPDFGKPGVADEKVEAKKNAGDQMQRQRELEKREEKRKMLATFVDENNVGVAEIQSAIEETAAMPAEQRKKGVDFGQFCKFNKVEPTGEYHRLFSLFDPYGKGTIDMKELALGMLNFVDLSKEEKTDLVFRIFDEDSSGLLTADELGNVLAANHMQSLDAVKKKAETIMRQADRDGNGELSLDEFRIVAQKFPNILFPAFSKDLNPLEVQE